MPKIILIRHGETDWNRQGLIQGRTDNSLNTLGFQQAREAAPLFQDLAINAIISSPMLRAKQTAQTLADHLNYTDEILYDSRIVERDFGEANGKHVDEAYAKVFTGDILNLETEQAIMDRVMEALYEFGHAYPNDDQIILVVAHSHVIKAALCAIAPEHYTFKEKLVNVSANFLQFYPLTDEWKIEAINVTITPNQTSLV
ncbi:MAG: histidine phosphatase family protein [Culicoidibacterales bacterium]